MAIAHTHATACADCEGLKLSRHCEPPHEYLVLRRERPISIYQCLVCHTNLTFNLHDEGVPQWVALSELPEQLHRDLAPTAERRPQLER